MHSFCGSTSSQLSSELLRKTIEYERQEVDMMKSFKKLQDRMAKEGDEGFTLIELLIVIVVLGILAAVVVFALSSVNHNRIATKYSWQP